MIEEIFEKCREIQEQDEGSFPDDLVAVTEIMNLEQAIEWIKAGGYEIADFVRSVGEEPEVLVGKWVMTEDAYAGPQDKLEAIEEPILIYTVVHNRPYSEEVPAYTDGENIFVSESYLM